MTPKVVPRAGRTCFDPVVAPHQHHPGCLLGETKSWTPSGVSFAVFYNGLQYFALSFTLFPQCFLHYVWRGSRRRGRVFPVSIHRSSEASPVCFCCYLLQKLVPIIPTYIRACVQSFTTYPDLNAMRKRKLKNIENKTAVVITVEQRGRNCTGHPNAPTLAGRDNRRSAWPQGVRSSSTPFQTHKNRKLEK